MTPNKLQIQVSCCDLPVSAANPWGDFDRIVIVRSRIFNQNDVTPDSCSLYFKACKHTGALTPITEADFSDACVVAALQKTVPTIVEL